jgi:hypothetical protein
VLFLIPKWKLTVPQKRVQVDTFAIRIGDFIVCGDKRLGHQVTLSEFLQQKVPQIFGIAI